MRIFIIGIICFILGLLLKSQVLSLGRWIKRYVLNPLDQGLYFVFSIIGGIVLIVWDVEIDVRIIAVSLWRVIRFRMKDGEIPPNKRGLLETPFGKKIFDLVLGHFYAS